MRRIFTANRVLDMFGLGKDGFKNSNKASGVNATELDADLFNEWQEELAAIVEHGGGTLVPGTRNQIITKILALIAATGGITPTEADARYISRQYMLLHDEKPMGTQGGASLTGTNTRVLNTVAVNTITGASLAGNQISLPAGVYRISGRAQAGKSDAHKAYLYNVTDSVMVINGSSVNGSAPTSSDQVYSESVLKGRIVIASTKVFELRHWFQSGAASDGLGSACNFTGFPEIYSQLEIIREGS